MLNSIDTLLGKSIVGGGKKTHKTKGLKVKKNKVKKFRVGLFGGEFPDQYICTKINSNPVNVPQQQAPPAQAAVAIPPVRITQPAMEPVPIVGQNPMKEALMRGGKLAKKAAAYKKLLKNMTLERLQKIATKKGVKVTKKKDGKRVNIKKATLVRKLCECKYGKY